MASRMKRGLIPRTPLNTSLLVLLLMAGVSLYATFDVRVSLVKVAGLVFGVVVFWAIARWVDTAPRLDAAVDAFAVAGAALAAIGVLGATWIDKFPLLTPVIALLPRVIRGVPGAERGFHPNEIAGCLVLFVPLQTAILFEKSRRWAAGLPLARRERLADCARAVMLLLTAGTLVLTQSRGAWVGVIVATVAFLAWHSRTTRVIAAAICVAAAVLVVRLGPTRMANVAISQSGPGMASDVTGRTELWSRAIYGIQDFPFTGMGMNTFRKLLPRMYPTFLTAPDFDVAHAHNQLLQAALDLGIPGLIAYVSIWMIAAALLVAVYRRPERHYRLIAGGLGVGLIAHFAFGMTDAVALGSKGGVVFWLALGLTVALHRIAVTDPGAT